MSAPRTHYVLREGRCWTQWVEMVCPYCAVHCFVNCGDPDDFCGLDVESARCHACGKVFLMPGGLEEMIDPGFPVTEDDLDFDPWDSVPMEGK